MLRRVLEEITLADLESLVTEGVPEGTTIEYKRGFYNLSAADSDQKTKQHDEMLKDISSFANSVGGDLIIGIAETNGIATNVCGFDEPDSDGMKLRITELLQRWVEPRMGCGMHSVQMGGNKCVLIIRVPRSLLAPHRVIYGQRFGQFWARNSAGAYAMDTLQLRHAFTLTETLYARIEHSAKSESRPSPGGKRLS